MSTSSQDCEVFMWDLSSRNKNSLYNTIDLVKIGQLVIKNVSSTWNVRPNKDQKLERQRSIKNEIYDKALIIREMINEEYREFNNERVHEESGLSEEARRLTEMKLMKKNIDVR